jgi:putative peptidoglycan lipid II flippase
MSEIFYMLAIAPVLISQNQIKGLAISVIAGGALHFFIQYPKLKSLGWSLGFQIDLKHPALKRIFLLMIPSIIGLSVDQINSFIDTICASFLEGGAITALYYSNRLMQLPLAIFGLALASASLPALSKAFVQKEYADFKNSLNYSIRLNLFALIPAAAGLMVIGFEIVRLLFERGRFDTAASVITNNALFYYSLGLPAYSSSKIFANAFYAFQDTKTPVKIAAWAMVVHVILCVVLMRSMGVGGLAFATSAASYFNSFLLAVCLKKRIGALGFRQIFFSSLKTFFAAVCSGIAAWYSVKISGNLFIAVPFAIAGSLIVFLIAAKFLKSEELNIFVNILKKRGR